MCTRVDDLAAERAAYGEQVRPLVQQLYDQGLSSQATVRERKRLDIPRHRVDRRLAFPSRPSLGTCLIGI